jgi:hypothetical protein
VSWDQQFFDPIILPGRKQLVTLRDAANYIVTLPKGGTAWAKMAGGSRSADAGRRTRRRSDDGEYRDDAGAA